jgi:DNA-binding transcriptional MerR regulator/ubiquinone/menaquinone biosynthesis C-methylase UbiE
MTQTDGYYTSGEFAKMAHVTVRTIRYYDKQNILKPSFVNANGTRFYTDGDLARLQQILLFKYLGFSLDDIREMTIGDPDLAYLRNSLQMQKKLVQDRIEQMHLVEDAIETTVALLDETTEINWSQMLHLIHLTGMEQSLKSQYLNASNISARIRLHSACSRNPEGWFPWLLRESLTYFRGTHSPKTTPVEQPDAGLTSAAILPAAPGETESLKGLQILELGCGSGALWTENRDVLAHLPNVRITLSDISEGIIRDLRRSMPNENGSFSFDTFDCHNIPYRDSSFDIVYANHLLFYCEDIPGVLREVRRVLRPGGLFCCSTYSRAHMREITDLVQSFDSRIVLSADALYEQFGLENGQTILQEVFSKITLRRYDDEIILDRAEPLIEYILSCHGNQNRYLLDRYRDFREYADAKVHPEFHITKDAGIFLCQV